MLNLIALLLHSHNSSFCVSVFAPGVEVILEKHPWSICSGEKVGGNN